MGCAALLSSSSASHRHRHRQRERGRHAFPPALTFAITFYSAVDIGHTCHAALASSVNPLFLSVATKGRIFHFFISGSKRRRFTDIHCILRQWGRIGNTSRKLSGDEPSRKATMECCAKRHLVQGFSCRSSTVAAEAAYCPAPNPQLSRQSS